MESQRYEVVEYRILKIGRKWIEGEVPEKGWRAKIEINDVSRDWKVGDVVSFPAMVKVERNKYGTKVFVYPISEERYGEIRKEEMKKKYERVKKEIEDAVKEGWYPDRKAKKLLEIGEKIGLRDEALSFVEEAKKEVKMKKERSKYRELISKIHNLVAGRDRYSYYKELYEKVKALVENTEQQELKDLWSEDREWVKKKGEEVRREEYWATAQRYVSKLMEVASKEIRVYRELLEKLINLREKAEKLGYEEVVEMIDEGMVKAQDLIEKNREDVLAGLDPRTVKELEGAGLSLSDIKKLRSSGKLKEGVFYRVMPVGDSRYRALAVNVIKKMGGFALRRGEKRYVVVAEDRVDDAMYIMKNIVGIIRNELLTREGDSEVLSDGEFRDIMPRGWNHLKREYVAELMDDLSLNYISKRVNYTRSGANADLVVESIPSEVGSLVVIHAGSHRHPWTSIYRRDQDGWRCVASGEGSLYDVLLHVADDIEIEEEKGEDREVSI